MATRLIDLSHPLEMATPPWPGNPGVDFEVVAAIPAERGPGWRRSRDEPVCCNTTCFRTCNHTGTHMDAPAHFYNGVPTIERVSHIVSGQRQCAYEVTPKPARTRARRSAKA